MRADIKSVCRALVPILGQVVAASDLEELTCAVVVAITNMPPTEEIEFNFLSTGGFRVEKRLNGTGIRLVFLVEPSKFVIFGDVPSPPIGHPTHGRLITFCWGRPRGDAVSVDYDFADQPNYGELILSMADIFRAAPELRKPLTIDSTALAVIRNVDAMIPVMAAA